VRFVWAVVAFLVAVGLIGTGVARLALASEPDTVTSPIAAADAELPYTVIDADVLSAYPGQQGLTISDSENEIFVSYGRTSDIKAWLSDTSYNHAALADGRAENGEPKVSVEVVDATNAYSDTGERVWWNPRDSDLWIEQLTAEDSLQRDFALPEGMSLLIATDGTAPAPADVSVTWQTGAITTPWAGPLIAAGCLALLIGLVFWILGFIHLRRRRASRASARRALWAIPTVTVAGALLAGCTPSAWPDFSNDPSPTPSPTLTTAPEAEMPAVTDAQAERIVASMAQVLADADRETDIELGAKRLTGAAYDMRKTAYEIRADVEDWKLPVALPAGPVSVLLPQANDGWPRTALMVVGDADEKNPTILFASQQSPWETYKISYMGSIVAGTELPELAPAWMGAVVVPPESSFLEVTPAELAGTYADIVANGDESEYDDLFDIEGDAFLTALHDKRKATLDTFNESATSDDERTASMTFDQRGGDGDPVALATFDSGAIVAVPFLDSEKLEPTVDDGIIKIPDAPEIQHFVGEEETKTGLTTYYRSQLFFYVPAKASEEKVRILGFSYALADAKLLEEQPDEEN
jgi:hypothetical protein